MTEDLVLDPNILYWVLVPIAYVMFLVAILRNNIALLLQSSNNDVKMQEVTDK